MRARRISRRGRIPDQVRAEIALLLAAGTSKAAAAREAGCSRESVRKMQRDPLWCHWREVAVRRLREGARSHVVLRELLEIHLAPEPDEEERACSYVEFRDDLVARLKMMNAQRAAKGLPAYTAHPAAIDAFVQHVTGEPPEADEQRAKCLLIDLLVWGPVPHEPDELSECLGKTR